MGRVRCADRGLVTGRHLPFGFPRAVRGGWRLRLGGLVYLVIGTGNVYLVMRSGGLHLDPVVGTCLLVAVMLIYAIRQERAAAG